MQTAQGLVAKHQLELSALITSQLKNQSKAIRRWLTAESSLFLFNVLRRADTLHRKGLLGCANLQCTYARRKFVLSQIIHQMQNIDVSMHSLLFTPILVIGNISLLMLRGMFCILALLLEIKL